MGGKGREGAAVPQTCQWLGGSLRMKPQFTFSLVSSSIFADSLSMKCSPLHLHGQKDLFSPKITGHNGFLE